MAIRYSQEFKGQAIEKTLQRGDKTIQCIADKLIHHSHIFMLGGESYRLKSKLNK